MGPEAHRRAHSLDRVLLRQEVDDRMRGLRIELGTVRAFQAQGRPRESDRGQLESEAHALERDLVLGCEAGRRDFPLDPAVPETSRDQDAIGVLEGLRALFLEIDGLDPLQLHMHARGGTRVMERLDVTDVRILQMGVLAHQRDRDFLLRALQVLEEGLPFPHVLGFRAQAEGLHRVLGEALPIEEERHVVDRRRVRRADDALHRDVGKECDLLLDLGLQGMLAAGDDHVRLDPGGPEFPYALLRRLRLLLADRPHHGDEGRVDEQDVLLPLLLPELADRFEEGHSFDVADGPTDFDEDDVGVFLLPHLPEQRLDLVRDVGVDLDRLAEIVAAAFLLDDGPVALPGRDDDIFHVKSRDWSIRRVDDKVCVQEWRNTCSGITPSRDTSVEATRQASRRGIKPKIPDGSALNSARPPAHASMCTEAPPSTSWAVTTKFRVPVHQMLPRRALSWIIDVISTFIPSSDATPLATAKTHSLFRPGSMKSARLRPTKLKRARTPKAFGCSGESLLRPLE